MQDRLLRLKDVCEITSMSPSTVRRRIKDDGFPPGIKIGPRARRFYLSEILEWMKNRPRAA